MNINKLKPNGARLLLHKCENAEPEGLILPPMTKDNTDFCQVLAVGPKCNEYWRVGAIVRLEVTGASDNLTEVPDGNGEFWLAHESIIEPAEYGVEQ